MSNKPTKPPTVDPTMVARFVRTPLLLWSLAESDGIRAHVGIIVEVDVITVTITEPSGRVDVADVVMRDVVMRDVLVWTCVVDGEVGGGVGQVEKSVDVGRDVVTGIWRITCDSTVLICSPERLNGQCTSQALCMWSCP